MASGYGLAHVPMSPAPTNTCGVPGVSTKAVSVSHPVAPSAAVTLTRTRYVPVAPYVWPAVRSWGSADTFPCVVDPSPHSTA